MERTTKLEIAQKIMGKNFIGPDELSKIGHHIMIFVPKNIPDIHFSESFLKKARKDYILILGIGKDNKGKVLTINRMREILGTEPKKSEPCFYNQDWYLRETFAAKETLKLQWYLIKKFVDSETRGVNPSDIEKKMKNKEQFPSAILCVFTFFAYYLSRKEILWENDFIWCQDKDINKDRIYVGRYKDIQKINKNGFNIHRHLSLKKSYGYSSYYTSEN